MREPLATSAQRPFDADIKIRFNSADCLFGWLAWWFRDVVFADEVTHSS